MSKPQPSLVWYVSYGSNLNRARFLTYILGGTPPGSQVGQRGCADQTLPRGDRAIEIPYELYFAGHSPHWGGHSAFIDSSPGRQATKARAYLIGFDQFQNIIQEENYRPEPIPIPPLTGIISQGHFDIPIVNPHLDQYDRLIHCGILDDYPMLSFCPSQRQKTIGPPAPGYLRKIADGLQEAHHLTTTETVAYLAEKTGIKGHISRHELTGLLTPKAAVHS